MIFIKFELRPCYNSLFQFSLFENDNWINDFSIYEIIRLIKQYTTYETSTRHETRLGEARLSRDEDLCVSKIVKPKLNRYRDVENWHDPSQTNKFNVIFSDLMVVRWLSWLSAAIDLIVVTRIGLEEIEMSVCWISSCLFIFVACHYSNSESHGSWVIYSELGISTGLSIESHVSSHHCHMSW